MPTILSLTLCSIVFGVAVADDWADVEHILSSFKNLTNGTACPGCKGFAFTAGDATGRKYSFEKETTLSQPLLMASASKFPAAVAISGAVADGHLTFDTYAHQVFSWWTDDPSDLRSGVTLRQLLSFRSGIYWPDPSSGNCSCMGIAGGFLFTAEACARQIYEQAPFKFAPGTTFAYNSFHLQVAGAMAAKAANLSVQELLHKYLIDKLQLNHTGWLFGRNPQLAAGMHTTGEDYDRILQSYIAYEVLPESIASQMEIDYLANGTKVCDWCTELTGSLGDYSMCNWYECIRDNISLPFSEKCRIAKVHNDAGLFGYYPLFDRAKNMYMQIVQSVIVGLNATNYGVNNALVLRQLVKPSVDKALGSPDPIPPSPQRASAASMMLQYPEMTGEVWSEFERAIDQIQTSSSSSSSLYGSKVQPENQ